jgi:hypothetical protein
MPTLLFPDNEMRSGIWTVANKEQRPKECDDARSCRESRSCSVPGENGLIVVNLPIGTVSFTSSSA